jgi:membrane protease subunit HflC
MQSRLPSVLAGVLLVAILVVYMCSFQVRSTEVAIVKTFGKADENKILTTPGWRGKWPWPIQEVVKYDKRIRILEDTVEETPTADSKNVTITTFTGWSVADPYRFHKAYPDLKQGEEALRTKIRSHKKAVVGRHSFSEFVSTDPKERHLREIEDEMKQLVASEARAEFGVEVEIFGIKRLGLPTEVTKAIFDQMKKTEQNKADNYENEGKARAQEIVARAEEKKSRILAVAERKVADIRSEGLARVGQIYQSFADYPELRIFLDKLRALEKILKTRSTLILDTKFAPTDLFDEQSRLNIEKQRFEVPPAPPAPETVGGQTAGTGAAGQNPPS